MKQTFTYLFLIISISVFSNTQWTIIDNSKSELTNIELISSNIDQTIINFDLNAYKLKRVTTQNGNEYIVKGSELTPILEQGAPDLSKFTQSIIIPNTGQTKIEIISSDYFELKNIDIAPSKGNLTRDIDPVSVPYSYGNVYSQDSFYPGSTASLKSPYILRDFRAQTIVFNPFQYNPVTKTLRIYTNIQVKVSKVNGVSGVNEFYNVKTNNKTNDEFKHIYNGQFLNYQSANTKYTPLDEGTPGNMLIICHSSYLADMQDFVDWKREKGIETVMVDQTIAGTTASQIKSYIANYYNTNGLVYLLLVGDAQHIPASSTSGGDSDVDYGYISGSDHYAEIFIGRFSAESSAHVQTQVARTIEYEKNPVPGDWWENAVLIASSEGPGDDSEYDYAHAQNMLTDLLGFTYAAGSELYDGNQGGNDASGDPSAAMLGTEINNGKSVVLYTGHGSDNSFVTTGFSNTNVDALTNNNKYPFIYSVACVNGNFVGQTCFGEAWLRATNNGQPSGAVATFMSTINQSWDPPMHGQDEMVDIMVESYANNIKRTFAGIGFNGCFEMNDEYSDFNMTDTWTIFGDPSVVVRTDNPFPLTATHNPTITLGATNFTVNCSIEGALVSLTKKNAGQVEILGTGYISGGTVSITIPGFTAPDTMLVTTTAFNYSAYTANVVVIASSGPYVVHSSNVINDPTGNNNNLADYNEDILLDVTLENIGVSQATGVSASISTSNPSVTITDATESFGDINTSATATQSDAYAFSIADGIADQTSVLFDMSITDGIDIWPSTIAITCNAPEINQSYVNTDDSATGNDDGMLDAGETVDINVEALNIGHSESVAASCVLTSSSPYVTINSGSVALGNLSVGVGVPNTHNITIDGSTPTGTMVDLTFTVTAGSYSDVFTTYLSIGLMIEDWESNSFVSYNWADGGNIPWTIITSYPYEGLYCAQSGDITHSQTSELIIDMNVTTSDTLTFYKKVSCEQGYISYGYPYDYLDFQIDGTSMGMWDGEIAWSQESYPITAGSHSLKWIYAKDNMEDGGSDCAWIDYIKLPPHSTITTMNYLNTNVDFSLDILPNPVNNDGTIVLNIQDQLEGELIIYNVLGKKVSALTNKRSFDAGTYNIHFNAAEYDNGIYLCKFISTNSELTKRLIISK